MFIGRRRLPREAERLETKADLCALLAFGDRLLTSCTPCFAFDLKSVRLPGSVPRRKRKSQIGLTSFVTLLLLFALLFAWARTPLVRAVPPPTGHQASPATPGELAHRAKRHGQQDASDATPTDKQLGSREADGHVQASSVNQSVHVALGVPTDSDPSDDYLLDHGIFVLSYNPQRNVPNWVAWELDRSFLGHVRRKNDFRIDPALPANVRHITPQDYRDSGYDRGHMCPSADRQHSPSDNSLTFLMTNSQPQLHELNEGPWEKLEEYERELAHQRDAELFIIAGGIFDKDYRSIGHGVAVPKANFKIIVALRQGQSASDVKSETKTIAVVMPNEVGVGLHPWTDYLKSVDAIEAATGYEFLSNVNKGVQDVIEARVASSP
jgi:endonuclease G